MERVHVACCTNPFGEILAEPFTLFQERRSLVLEMHRPYHASFGLTRTAPDPTLPLQKGPCPARGRHGGRKGPGLLGSYDTLTMQFLPALHQSAWLQGNRRTQGALPALEAAKATSEAALTGGRGGETALRADPA